MAAQCPASPSLDPFQGIPEMLSAPGAGPRARGGQQLGEVKAKAAIPDKRWALPHYGYGNHTNKSARYFILGMSCPDRAAPPRPSDLVLFWEE